MPSPGHSGSLRLSPRGGGGAPGTTHSSPMVSPSRVASTSSNSATAALPISLEAGARWVVFAKYFNYNLSPLNLPFVFLSLPRISFFTRIQNIKGKK